MGKGQKCFNCLDELGIIISKSAYLPKQDKRLVCQV